MILSSSKIAQGQNGGESASTPRVIAGVVRDTANEGVQVQANGREAVLTDSSRRFRVVGVNGSSVVLEFRRLGYEPAARTIALRNTGAGLVEVVLTPNSQLLRTIVVEGQAYGRELWANGFYHRRKTASGSFFDQDFLSHFGGSGVGSLLHDVPRVRVERKHNQDYAFSTVGGNRCRMNVYLDGVFQRAAMPSPNGSDEGAGLSELIDYHDIRAIEVYPGAMSVPTQFTRMGPGGGKQGGRYRGFPRRATCTPHRPEATRTRTPPAALSSSGRSRRARNESAGPPRDSGGRRLPAATAGSGACGYWTRTTTSWVARDAPPRVSVAREPADTLNR
jgi:hypothetical protein